MNAHRKVGPVAKPSLLCEFGWHKTDALALWNDGYYFSKCARCRQDLVRTAFGRWTVPRGFRVVWAAQSPQGTPPVHLVPERGAGDAPPGTGELPVVGTAAINASTIAAGVPVSDAKASSPIEPAADAEPRKRTDPREAVGERSLRYLFPAVQDGNPEPVKSAAPAPLATPSTSKPPSVGEPVIPVSQAPVPEEQPTPVSPDDEPMANEAPPPATATETEADAPPPRKPLIPDFMDGGAPLEVPYDLTTGRILPPEEQPATLADVQATPVVVSLVPIAPPRRVGERVRTAATSARAFVDARASATAKRGASTQGPSTRSRAFVERHAGLVAATVFGAFVVVAATIDRSDAPASYRPLVRDAEPVRVPAVQPQRVAAISPTPVSPAPIVPTDAPPALAPEPAPPPMTAAPVTPAPQPIVAIEAEPTPTKAIVTASILRCRAKPDDGSATVRKLTRGVSVELVDADAGPGWVSVTQNGKACWVSERYLSKTRRG